MEEALETGVQSLGWDDPLEEGLATRSSILAWEMPQTGAWWAIVHRVRKSWTRLKQLSMHALILQTWNIHLVPDAMPVFKR